MCSSMGFKAACFLNFCRLLTVPALLGHVATDIEGPKINIISGLKPKDFPLKRICSYCRNDSGNTAIPTARDKRNGFHQRQQSSRLSPTSPTIRNSRLGRQDLKINSNSQMLSVTTDRSDLGWLSAGDLDHRKVTHKATSGKKNASRRKSFLNTPVIFLAKASRPGNPGTRHSARFFHGLHSPVTEKSLTEILWTSLLPNSKRNEKPRKNASGWTSRVLDSSTEERKSYDSASENGKFKVKTTILRPHSSHSPFPNVSDHLQIHSALSENENDFNISKIESLRSSNLSNGMDESFSAKPFTLPAVHFSSTDNFTVPFSWRTASDSKVLSNSADGKFLGKSYFPSSTNKSFLEEPFPPPLPTAPFNRTDVFISSVSSVEPTASSETTDDIPLPSTMKTSFPAARFNTTEGFKVLNNRWIPPPLPEKRSNETDFFSWRNPHRLPAESSKRSDVSMPSASSVDSTLPSNNTQSFVRPLEASPFLWRNSLRQNSTSLPLENLSTENLPLILLLLQSMRNRDYLRHLPDGLPDCLKTFLRSDSVSPLLNFIQEIREFQRHVLGYTQRQLTSSLSPELVEQIREELGPSMSTMLSDLRFTLQRHLHSSSNLHPEALTVEVSPSVPQNRSAMVEDSDMAVILGFLLTTPGSAYQHGERQTRNGDSDDHNDDRRCRCKQCCCKSGGCKNIINNTNQNNLDTRINIQNPVDVNVSVNTSDVVTSTQSIVQTITLVSTNLFFFIGVLVLVGKFKGGSGKGDKFVIIKDIQKQTKKLPQIREEHHYLPPKKQHINYQPWRSATDKKHVKNLHALPNYRLQDQSSRFTRRSLSTKEGQKLGFRNRLRDKKQNRMMSGKLKSGVRKIETSGWKAINNKDWQKDKNFHNY